MKKYLLYLFCLSLLTMLSCTTGSNRSRGSLSDAMDKSRDDFEEEREVPDDEKPFYIEDEDDERYEENERIDNSEGFTPSLISSGSSSMLVKIRGGQSILAGPYFDKTTSGEILIGDNFDHWSVYLTAGLNIMDVNPSHKVSKSIMKNPIDLNMAMEGRYYFFKRLKICSPYVLGRIGGYIFLWQFKNPLETETETITSDSLGGLILGTGAGLDFYRGDSFSIGAVVLPEWYIFGDETSEGFTNDYFGSQGIIRWALEAGLRF